MALAIRTAGTSMQRDSVNWQSELDLSSVQTLDDTRYRVDSVRRQNPVPTMHWHSVCVTQNGFFLESFLDEVARSANKDPVQLRRELLAHDPRALKVIDAAAGKARLRLPSIAARWCCPMG